MCASVYMRAGALHEAAPVQRALAEARQTSDPNAAAWTMRRAFDEAGALLSRRGLGTCIVCNPERWFGCFCPQVCSEDFDEREEPKKIKARVGNYERRNCGVKGIARPPKSSEQ